MYYQLLKYQHFIIILIFLYHQYYILSYIIIIYSYIVNHLSMHINLLHDQIYKLFLLSLFHRLNLSK